MRSSLRFPLLFPLPFALVLPLLSLLASQTAGAAPGDHRFSQGYSGAGGLVDVSSASGGSGDIAAVGTFFGSVDFGGGAISSVNPFAPDVYVARLDTDGAHLHSAGFATSGFGGVQVGAVAVDAAGNLYVGGRIYTGSIDFGGGALSGPNAAFIAKFDASGAHLFSATYGDASIFGLAASAAGVAIVGETRASCDFGGGTITTAGGADAIVARLDASGAHVFSAGYGDADDQIGRAVAMDAAGNVWVAGGSRGTIDLGGGGLALVSAGIFFAGYGPTGTHAFSTVFSGSFAGGSSVASVVPALALSSSGRLALAGEMRGSVDFGGGALASSGSADAFVAVYDGSGAHQWSRVGGVATFEAASDVAFDPSGNVVVAGTMLGAGDFGGGPLPFVGPTDLFVATYGSAGAHLTSQSFGPVWSAGVGADPTGHVVLSGSGPPGIDFGGGPLAGTDLFLAELEGQPVAGPPPLPALAPGPLAALAALLAGSGALARRRLR